jgi:hypothetical protein
VSDVPRPSYDELAAENVVLREQVALLVARLAELEARLNQNSRNSSKPPSSDSPFAKPSPKSLRERGKRRPGRPSGQQGVTSSRSPIRSGSCATSRTEECSCCGASLARAARAGVERRQVFEVPEVRPVVTERRIIARRCRCGQVTKALAPAHVSVPVVYGPRACALALGCGMGSFSLGTGWRP